MAPGPSGSPQQEEATWRPNRPAEDAPVPDRPARRIRPGGRRRLTSAELADWLETDEATDERRSPSARSERVSERTGAILERRSGERRRDDRRGRARRPRRREAQAAPRPIDRDATARTPTRRRADRGPYAGETRADAYAAGARADGYAERRPSASDRTTPQAAPIQGRGRRAREADDPRGRRAPRARRRARPRSGPRASRPRSPSSRSKREQLVANLERSSSPGLRNVDRRTRQRGPRAARAHAATAAAFADRRAREPEVAEPDPDPGVDAETVGEHAVVEPAEPATSDIEFIDDEAETRIEPSTDVPSRRRAPTAPTSTPTRSCSTTPVRPSRCRRDATRERRRARAAPTTRRPTSRG